MNTKQHLLYLLAIPYFFVSAPDASFAIADPETTILEKREWLITQAPNYNYYQRQIIKRVINTLIEQGKLEQALNIVERTKGKEDWDELLSSIALEAASVKKFDLALQSANYLKYRRAKNHALSQIAISLAEAGQPERALQIIKPLSQGFSQKARVLAAITRNLAAQDRVEEALQIAQSLESKQEKAVLLSQVGLLEEALQLAETLEEVEKAKTLGSIATALAEGGEFEEGIKLAKSLPLSPFQGSIFSDIIIALTKREKWNQALEVAQLIKNDYEDENQEENIAIELLSQGLIRGSRNRALTEIVRALKEAGELEQALKVAQSIDSILELNPYQRIPQGAIAVEFALKGEWEKALEITRSTEYEYDDYEIAGALAKTGEFEQALEIARSTEDEYDDSQVAIELAKIGKFAEATKIAHSLQQNGHNHGDIFVTIAQVLAREGRAEEAMELNQQVPESQQEWILGGVAKGLVAVEFQEAVRIMQSLENVLHKRFVAQEMAIKLTNEGQVDQALQLAKLVKIPYYDPDLAQLLGDIAVNFAKLGDFDRALETVQSIHESFNSSGALEVIATELAAVGQVDRALALSNNQDDTSSQAYILGGVAVGLAKKGEFKEALTIVEDIEEDFWVKDSTIEDIILHLIETKKFTQAIEVTRSLISSVDRLDYRKANILERVVIAFTQAEQFDLALQIVQMLNLPAEDEYAVAIAESHSSSLSLVQRERAMSRFEAGNLEEALEIAESLQNRDKGRFLGEIAQAIVKSGNTEKALQLAESLPGTDREIRVFMVAQIAVALTEEGKVDQAIELTNPLQRQQKFAVLVDIIYALLEQGKIEQAWQLAKTIPDYPDWALMGVAIELAQIGEIEQAMEIAQTLDEESQGWIYASVVVNLVEQGEIDRARKVSQAIKERYLYYLELAIIDSVKKSNSLQLQQLLQFLPDVSRKIKVLNKLAEYYIEVGEKEQATELLNKALSMVNRPLNLVETIGN